MSETSRMDKIDRIRFRRRPREAAPYGPEPQNAAVSRSAGAAATQLA
jgi:hypothetical protein